MDLNLYFIYFSSALLCRGGIPDHHRAIVFANRKLCVISAEVPHREASCCALFLTRHIFVNVLMIY